MVETMFKKIDPSSFTRNHALDLKDKERYIFDFNSANVIAGSMAGATGTPFNECYHTNPEVVEIRTRLMEGENPIRIDGRELSVSFLMDPEKGFSVIPESKGFVYSLKLKKITKALNVFNNQCSIDGRVRNGK